MVTVCCVVMLAGAVYKPDGLMVPTPAGVIVQFTAGLLVLVTPAVNCCVQPPYSVVLSGVTLTDTGGIRVTVAESDGLEPVWLVAVTITCCCVVMLAGAVYCPDGLMVPTPAGVIVHVAAL
jgi:hypothetical protein